MYLEENGLVIRVAQTKDAATLCRWWNDGSVMAHAGFPKGLGTTTEEIIMKISQDTEFNRRLILEYNRTLIGEMSYRTVEKQIAEIGIKICEASQQEKGLGTRYLMMLIRYLFHERNYIKILLDTNLNNKRAQHVYEKIGFQKIGIRENAWKDQMGEYQTAVDYELTKDLFLDKK
ncbi:GNAT family N-acetyltransferase [Mobilitalea sibirica]|uniref:GNAT family N-acetyltransferase n=1 Tax=Mobilitalea sibirica TaxID=1462919 RepID=A0A8J7H2W4_9FIRM|nr:GNAT family protein [Mobilitalea sibirica]MBH1941248.1 GNAT family N-acetyltransferase [Mobilitalea sibirica]